MITKERFEQGMTFAQYLDQMGTNKEKFVQFLSEAKVRPEDKAVFADRTDKLNVLVLTEDWCGDALYNLPVLAKMVEGAPNVDMRVFLRDRNPDLMSQYLNQGLYKSIPVFVFFDAQMKELARFVERPPVATEYMEKKQLELRRAMRDDTKDEWRQVAVDHIKELVKP
jgi:hypothetical protein